MSMTLAEKHQASLSFTIAEAREYVDKLAGLLGMHDDKQPTPQPLRSTIQIAPAATARYPWEKSAASAAVAVTHIAEGERGDVKYKTFKVRFWQQWEIDRAVELLKLGYDDAGIAKAIKRSEDAVRIQRERGRFGEFYARQTPTDRPPATKPVIQKKLEQEFRKAPALTVSRIKKHTAKHWTQEDVTRAEEMLLANKSLNQVAAALNRTRKAVEQQRSKGKFPRVPYEPDEMWSLRGKLGVLARSEKKTA